MVKIDIEKIKDTTTDRHKSACASDNNTTTKKEYEAIITGCNEGEYQINWQEK